MRLLVVAVFVLFCSVVQAAEKRTITVGAKSEIKVAPDEVILQLEVNTRDKHLSIAKRDNDEITTAVLGLVPKYSIPAKDVKITNLDLAPDYGRYDNRFEKPIAYDYTRSIRVRLTNFKTIEPFLSDAIDAGLRGVSRLHFRVSNQRQHQFEARKLAVIYAREKATHLTELTNMKLGSPIRIEEDIEHNYSAVGFGGAGAMYFPQNKLKKDDKKLVPRQQGLMYVALQKNDENNVAKLLITPGQITISAEVEIEFEMSPK